MSLDDLEAMITKFWEGIFRKRNRPIQPVEMARALVREMVIQRRVSVSRVYAPNIFTISLGKADFQKSASLQDALSQELAGYVKNKAIEKEYTLIGRPQIAFIEDDSLEIGEIAIKSAFSSEEPLPAEEPIKMDHTMIFDKQEKESRVTGKNYSIVIISGPDQGKSILLQGGEPYYIGRKSTNHLVLTDINASREHVLLERRGDILHLIDLGSRNGTFVDGIRIEEYELEVGDQFLIGENLFEVEGS
ncbi:FhaA domain-containing protein [Syntrophaceticus schinkii]|jgi:hypothetical protein|uniref:Putative FHA domain containing protein n=1 Tax=Syntrophaceticus schinkii TaxID=499207 RepID=A0A0B7MN66_9FIRM|nr:DUF3662 and FHA domain-containing protein [Syntrophaceticus schinkii]MDD2359226.1 DUF3662 and FHA domain-containing protein [Syntrophaceticus schinkii]MDD4261082.1 DUF3662 and FHA domain-containing protein [Syntrophaceticus schinkii]MDD4674542.1 DUF3662 and FHA domain-containing protein [Syntrophaceticus schinkii]CEO89411.1 putative FHA domain containing protein [Syntrophaceticus schinkii]